MKTLRLSSLPKLLALSALASTVLMASAQAAATMALWGTAGINLGQAGQAKEWAIFALSGGVTLTDTTSSYANPVVAGSSNGYYGATVYNDADVGMFSGSLSLAGNANVRGTARIRAGGTIIGNPSLVSNGLADQTNNGGDLLAAYYDALNASAFAAGLTTSNFTPSITGWSPTSSINQNTPISFVAPLNAGGRYVLNLTNFVLTGGAQLSLTGNDHTSFVFNITGNFSLTGGKIKLFGGLDPGSVLFNIIGTGSTVTLTSGAEVGGIILAPKRTVSLTGASKVFGTVIGDKVTASGGSKVIKPTYFSP
jgi:hypothetical protein